jgi:hypothetical protein
MFEVWQMFSEKMRKYCDRKFPFYFYSGKILHPQKKPWSKAVVFVPAKFSQLVKCLTKWLNICFFS